MEMSSLLMRRAAWVTLLGLCCALLAALWQAQRIVRHEGVGALRTAELMAHLAALQGGGQGGAGARLDALRRINASGELRHLQLLLKDGEGRVLVAPAQDEAVPAPFQALRWVQARWQGAAAAPAQTWRIARGDGGDWQASLVWNPLSEQREAFGDIVGVLALLCVFSAMMLGGICWVVRRALAPLRDILHAISRYERSDYAHRLPAMPTRELDAIARALNHLAGALAHTQATRRALSLRVLTLQEQERARLARELHDEFGQVLTAMRADTAYMARKTRADPALNAVAQDLAKHCERIHLDVRDLLRGLRPHGSQPGGGPVPLARMLGELVEGWRGQAGRHTAFALRLDLGGAGLPDELALSLYRMTQEALTNVVRHAWASQATVSLRADGAGTVDWSVEDDGVGMAAASPSARQGHGLDGLRERVWAHGAEIEISESAPGADRPGLRLAARFCLAGAGGPAELANHDDWAQEA